MSFLSTVLGIGEAAVGIAALVTGDPVGLALLADSAMAIGGVATVIGGLTGNKALSNFGSIVGAAGGVAGAGMSIVNAAGTVTDAASSVAAGTSDIGVGVSQGATSGAAGTAADVNAATNTAMQAGGAAATTAPSAAVGATATGATTTPGAAIDPATGLPSTAPVPPQNVPGAGGLSGTSLAQESAVDQSGVNGAVATPGSMTPVAPVSPGTPPTTPLAPGATGAPGQQFVSPETAQAASANMGGPTAPNQPGLLQSVSDWAGKNPMPALIGAQGLLGAAGGIASYIAPTPAQKAQIALEQANTAREQQIISMTAQRNANLAAAGPNIFRPGTTTNAPQNAPVNPNIPNPAVPPINNSPGNVYSINNSPTANPGLLGVAGAPTIPGAA